MIAKRSEDEMVAHALETDTALLPWIPELLTDLDQLGSNATATADVLSDLDLAKSTSVVDLGCGKGAVAVEIAANLNFNVLGIDLFGPFIECCKGLAERRGVSDLCHFIRGDILKLVEEFGFFDVSILAALGDVLGPLDQTVSVVRQYTKPGGHIVINDGFIKKGGSTEFPGFEQYAGHSDMIERLTACGDSLVREVIDTDMYDVGEGEKITARAQAIAERRPEIGAEVLNYAATQAAEYEYLNENYTSAIWVLERAY